MFTSRAEHRIHLRHDTADERLTPLSHQIGLASNKRMRQVERKHKETTEILSHIRKQSIRPDEANDLLSSISSNPIDQSVKADTLLSRPMIDMNSLMEMSPTLRGHFETAGYSKNALTAAETLLKYSGYIEREIEQADKLLHLDRIKIPQDFDFDQHQSISRESKEKLIRIRPDNLGQASRIPGVKPADISVLIIALNKGVSHETSKTRSQSTAP
jgi:tRNA uridine 5-carboxymethylaminomethyl modification enzyme